MGAGSSCTGAFDVVSEEEIRAAVKAIQDWEDAQRAGQRASQALNTVRKDSFKKAADDLNHRGSIVDRLGGPDRVHDIIQVFYRKLFASPELRQYFERLPAARMRAKQIKFMRYLVGGPASYAGSLRCVHMRLVTEDGLDKRRFGVMAALLRDTLTEMGVDQDVMDEVAGNVDAAREAIFTPTPDECVSGEELADVAAELAPRYPLIARLGGPAAVQAVTQSFFRRLFRSEELKYFFAAMSSERLRNMQFRVMRYVFCGPAQYAEGGGNLRCVHARMVKEEGLDMQKFNMVVAMLEDAMNEHLVSKANAMQVMANVEAARLGIFTPNPDEDVPGAQPPLAERPAGNATAAAPPAAAVAMAVASSLYGSSQPAAAPLAAGGAGSGSRPPSAGAAGATAAAAAAAPSGSGGPPSRQPSIAPAAAATSPSACPFAAGAFSSRPASAAAAAAAATAAGCPHSRPPSATGASPTTAAPAGAASSSAAAADGGGGSLYDRLGGDAGAGSLVDALHAALLSDPQLSHIFVGVNMAQQRARQLAFLRAVLGGGGAGGVGSAPASPRPGSAAAAGGDGGGGVATPEEAAARLCRECALSGAALEAVSRHLVFCLAQQGAPADVISGVLALQGPGRCLLCPPAAPALPPRSAPRLSTAASCPMSPLRSMCTADERALDDIMLHAAAAAVDAVAGATSGAAAAPAAAAASPRSPSGRLSRQATSQANDAGGAAATAAATAAASAAASAAVSAAPSFSASRQASAPAPTASTASRQPSARLATPSSRTPGTAASAAAAAAAVAAPSDLASGSASGAVAAAAVAKQASMAPPSPTAAAAAAAPLRPITKLSSEMLGRKGTGALSRKGTSGFRPSMDSALGHRGETPPPSQTPPARPMSAAAAAVAVPPSPPRGPLLPLPPHSAGGGSATPQPRVGSALGGRRPSVPGFLADEEEAMLDAILEAPATPLVQAAQA